MINFTPEYLMQFYANYLFTPWACYSLWCIHLTFIFIRPSSDGTYYGMVMSVRVSVRPTLRPVSIRPSGSPSARFPHFSPTCFHILSWNFAHDFVLMYYRSSLSVITLRQFLKELCLFVNLEYRKYSFPQFSPACSDILSWNFAHDLVLMHYRAISSVVTLRQFLKELCLFVNSEYRKYTVFRTFLLHTLTYWAEILHMNYL